jgi:hypothetical protein
MKLRSLTLTNLRKFAGQSATISGIGDGVSVVAEANEFGKSTFFDALHALFFVKYGAATREVKSLQPRAGGAVRVSAVIELPEGRFTIEKSFLAQKRASVHDGAGKLIALDDEAESWIAQLMGTGLEGPAGLLWVRQGVTALEPAGSTAREKENLLGARQNLLSSVAGEIDMVTGGRRMDRVIEAAVQALARLATASGKPIANGPWKEAEQEAQALEARHAELDRACTELAQALAERRDVTARLATLEAPGVEDALRRDLEQVQAIHDAAQAHAAKLGQAQAQVRLCQLEEAAAQARLDALITAARQLADAQQTRELADTSHGKAVDALERAEQAVSEAQSQVATAAKALAAANQSREAAQRDALRRNAAEKAEQAGARLAQVEQRRSDLEQARAALALHRVTPQVLSQIERVEADLDRRQAEAAAGGVQMQIVYDGDARITVEGTALEAGAHRLAQRQVLALEGIGRMTLDPGAAAADMAAVEEADARLRSALKAVEMPDLATARADAAQRREEEARIALMTSVIETLAPEGIEQIQQEAAQAQAALARMSAAPEADAVDPAELDRTLKVAREAEEAARAQYENTRDARDAARADQARAQADLKAAQAALEAATEAYGEPATFDTRRAKAARELATAQVTAGDAQATAEVLRGAAPDLESAKADLNRAKSAAENAREERARLRTRSAALTATIRTRAEDGVEEKRDETAERLEAATERAARFAHEAAGLRLLVEGLRAKRGAAQEAYFGPVQRELAPLLALLHEDAALSFDPASLLPQGLARGDGEEQLDMLSGGTQEQIAILTRLAFARLFARQGKPMPIILDDALVYSDDTRITAMFTALHRVAADQQVIVFTCRQMAFAGLGGVRPQVEVVQVG